MADPLSELRNLANDTSLADDIQDYGGGIPRPAVPLHTVQNPPFHLVWLLQVGNNIGQLTKPQNQQGFNDA